MAAPTAHSPVENFNLFGETGELPDVVHCETIETRSQIHNWEFKRHRHARLHQLLLIDSGGGSATIESRGVVLGPGALVNVPAGTVHGLSFQPGTSGWVVTLSSELLDEALHAPEGLGAMLSRALVLSSGARHRDLVRQIFEEYGTRSYARAHVLRSLSSLLLGQVARSIQALDISGPESGANPLRARFEALLEENYLNHWTVVDYSAHLAVSPTHLSRVLRQEIGLSANRAIQARILREARRNLIFTNLSVAEIAYLLGFNDPAYFSRVFAKGTGLSPTAFRASANRDQPQGAG